jgi:hypothetical protein
MDFLILISNKSGKSEQFIAVSSLKSLEYIPINTFCMALSKLVLRSVGYIYFLMDINYLSLLKFQLKSYKLLCAKIISKLHIFLTYNTVEFDQHYLAIFPLQTGNNLN